MGLDADFAEIRAAMVYGGDVSYGPQSGGQTIGPPAQIETETSLKAWSLMAP
jgi:hypothetical protein